MAGDGERQMLFDIRGRRKNVVRVVYAVLALLMGGSLFLTVGPFSIGEIFDTGGSSSSASEVFEEQVERIEGRLVKNPNDEALLLALTRAQISEGNSRIETSAQGEVQSIPPDARDDYDEALVTWNRYLKQAGDKPNPSAAQLVAATFFGVAERGVTSLFDLESSVDTAVAAQRIAAEQLPSVGTLSTLAIYEFFDGDFAAGDKATKQAAALAPSKGEAKGIEKQLAEYRKNAKEFEKRSERFAKAEREGGAGAAPNPLEGGIGAGLGQPASGP